jgi:hypothetical protein
VDSQELKGVWVGASHLLTRRPESFLSVGIFGAD